MAHTATSQEYQEFSYNSKIYMVEPIMLGVSLDTKMSSIKCMLCTFQVASTVVYLGLSVKYVSNF